MTDIINFTKMQSMGNDFVIIDLSINNTKHALPPIANELSCRKTGIGFDQMLIVNGKGDNFSFTITNADGSHAKQCVNGIRAVAAYVFKKHNITSANISNEAGSYKVKKNNNMEIIINFPNSFVKQILGVRDIKANKKSISPVYINLGNLHAVVELEDIGTANLDEISKTIINANNEQFNVSAYEVISYDKILARCLEIGSGETLSCGSGAIATAISYFHKSSECEVSIAQPGGTQTIKKECNHLTLIADATEVYNGSINLLSYRSNCLKSKDT